MFLLTDPSFSLFPMKLIFLYKKNSCSLLNKDASFIHKWIYNYFKSTLQWKPKIKFKKKDKNIHYNMQIQTSFTFDIEKQIKSQPVYSLRKKFNSPWKPFLYNSTGTERVITCCIGFHTFPSPPQCVPTYLSYTWNCNTKSFVSIHQFTFTSVLEELST